MLQSKTRNYFLERIQTGLHRSAVQTCSSWSEKYRVMGKPIPGLWRFDKHPWIKEVLDNQEEVVVVAKAAQMAFTEAGINKAFFAIDINGENVLYVLPTESDASDFSASRFDPALELSLHLRTLFTEVKNVGHKRAGAANLFIRGSRSPSKLQSLPVSMVIFDEYDQMNMANVKSAKQRVSGQAKHQIFEIANPTVEGRGIDAEYQMSSQKHFFFRCPHCNRLTELRYPECLIITAEDALDPAIKKSHVICHECKAVLKHEEKPMFLKDGIWVPAIQDRDIPGYTINQLYSCMKRPDEIAVQVLNMRFDQAEEQSFYNLTIGQAHSVAGAKVTDDNLKDCRGEYVQRRGARGRIITMGVDVGKYLHYEIDEWTLSCNGSTDLNMAAIPQVLKVGTVTDFAELIALVIDNNVTYSIIDANPERRKSYEFCMAVGNAKMCTYSNDLSTRDFDEDKANESTMVRLDRTTWLDLSLGRFRTKRIQLPADLPEEYKKHVKALVRVPKKIVNTTNDHLVEYLNVGDDHYGHARNYAEIAFKFALGVGSNEDI